MGNSLRIDHAALTDVGRMRSANEDNQGHLGLQWGQVFTVCDGMGGHVGGARASYIAVCSLLEFFGRDSALDPVASLRQAVSFANEQIYATALNQPDLKGMGTTCVVLLQKDSGVWLAHVGDSRIYLHTGGQLHKLTRDHSFVQGLVDKGMIAEEEAESHPRKNELLRALGIGSEVDVEITPDPIFPKAGDCFLLCSDGLNGMIGDRKIEEIMNSGLSLADKAGQLVAAANAAGGADNITVQLVEVLESPHQSNRYVAVRPPINLAQTQQISPAAPAAAPVADPDPRSPLQRYWVVILLAVAVITLGVMGLTGVFGDGGKAEREKFVADSLRADSLVKDSIRKVEIADSTHVADSLAKAKADSIEKAAAAPKPGGGAKPKPKPN